jgi:hypothetical protein
MNRVSYNWKQGGAVCLRWLLCCGLSVLALLLLANTALLLLHLLAVCCLCFTIAALVIPQKNVRCALAQGRSFLRLGRQCVQQLRALQEVLMQKKSV